MHARVKSFEGVDVIWKEGVNLLYPLCRKAGTTSINVYENKIPELTPNNNNEVWDTGMLSFVGEWPWNEAWVDLKARV